MDEDCQLIQEEFKILIYAFSIALISLAKTYGVDLLSTKEAQLEYAIDVQKRWRKKYEDGLNNVAEGKDHVHHDHGILPAQQELELKKSQAIPPVLDYSPEDAAAVGWFEGPLIEGKKETSVEMRDVDFESCVGLIEKVVTLSDEVERKSPYFPTSLHEMVYDEVELSQPKGKDPGKTNIFSEDSGIFSENASETNGTDLKILPDTTEKDVHSLKKLNTTVLDALEFILDHIKSKLDENSKELVTCWKGSPIAYACLIAGKCSLKAPEYEDALSNFTVDVLQGIWSDNEVDAYEKWSHQMCIVTKLLTTSFICQEVIFFTIDILEHVTAAVKKKHSTPSLIAKAAIFLDLLLTTIGTLNSHAQPMNEKPCHKQTDVRNLWRVKLFPNTVPKHGFSQVIKTDIIPKMDLFVMTIADKEPLLYLMAHQALDQLKDVGTVCSPPTSQDSLVNVS